MKNIEKNSRQTKFFHYLFFFLLLTFLIAGGTYLYLTESDRQLAREIEHIKDTSHVQYEEPKSYDDIVQRNENNLQEREYLFEVLNDPSTNLTKKQRKEFKKLLKEIADEIDERIEQETLEKKKEKERKDIVFKILKIRSKLNRLENRIEGTKNDLENRFNEQNK